MVKTGLLFTFFRKSQLLTIKIGIIYTIWTEWNIRDLYNNQINARALIGQSAVCYCAGKPKEKSRVFWIII